MYAGVQAATALQPGVRAEKASATGSLLAKLALGPPPENRPREACHSSLLTGPRVQDKRRAKPAALKMHLLIWTLCGGVTTPAPLALLS